MSKNILITGAAGLIGSNLCHWLLENTDHNIIGLDDLSGGSKDNLPPKSDRFIFYERNIIDDIDFTFILERPDICYHFACYAAVGVSSFLRCFNYKTNLVGTASVINACIKYNCKLIFASTNDVYSGVPPFDESMQPNPTDPYGVAKYACEMDIQIAGKQHNLDWVIIRPRNVYGERQNIFDKYRNVLGIWMYQILNDNPTTIFGDGLQKRSFTYIGDILEPLYNAAIYTSKEIIGLGSEKVYSINEANDILKEVIGKGETIHLEERDEVKEAFASIDKSVKLLGFEDITSLKNGITKMWNWAKSQKMRERKEWDKFELDKGVYSYYK